ncbi:MAG: APC family permease [Candidatus Nanopelagicales bacterium]|nr:APC family permease [Candidatus Nanopelagicales bacterium]
MPLREFAKRLMVGRALRSELLGQTLLSKRIALPVFASDALSSNAYATQEILLVLALGGASFYSFGPWIAAAVIVVYFVVIASYRQNVRAYPSGGGDYEVVSKNLGQRPGVLVAAALLIDYVLTVAVSMSAAIANLGSVSEFVASNAVLVTAGTIFAISLINLRGVRESGALFALPSYLFMLAIATMVGFAIFRMVTDEPMVAESAGWEVQAEGSFLGVALVFLVARAFASGTTALTGIEAIANGVPAFRKPKSRNAATVLLLLGVISMSMFAAITWLALKTQVHVAEKPEDLIGLPSGQAQKTVVVQIAEAVFPYAPIMVVFISAATALILALAANTAFNGFPVLGSVLARDGYLPRQLHTRGDRLAFSNGILLLALTAAVLVAAFHANVNSLIQLYIIGVFVSFTLSQIGMLRHWTRLLNAPVRPANAGSMRRARVINSIGAVVTGSVLAIVLVTKFTRGGWIVCVAIPLLYLMMRSIRRHYEQISDELAIGSSDGKVTLPSGVIALVLVSKIHKPTMRALSYARASRPSSLEAITVNVDSDDTDRLAREWERRDIPVPLRVLNSPYREVTRPVVDYVRDLRRSCPRDLVAVYIPQYLVGHWWEHLLHNQSAIRLRTRLMFTKGVVLVTVPWQLDSSRDLPPRAEINAPGLMRLEQVPENDRGRRS